MQFTLLVTSVLLVGDRVRFTPLMEWLTLQPVKVMLKTVSSEFGSENGIGPVTEAVTISEIGNIAEKVQALFGL